MKITPPPAQILIGKIMVYSNNINYARRVAELAEAQMARHNNHRGVADLGGLRIRWLALGQVR